MVTQILLLALALILVYVVIMQVGKAVELVSLMKTEEERYEESSKTVAFWFTLTGIFLAAFIAYTTYTSWHKFLPPPASAHGVWISHLITYILVLTGIIFVVTNFLLFYFTWKYRYRKDRKAYYYPYNNKIEVIWTVVPTLVFITIIGFSLDTWLKIFSEAPTEAIRIEATAKQFSWYIRYGGADNELGPRDFTLTSSDNELGVKWKDKRSKDDFLATEDIVLPVNKPVLVHIGALDVIHNFYLPEFRLMMDAVPGVPTKFWFRPTITTEEMRKIKNDPNFDYELACNQLCGQGHWNMRRVVKIVSEKEYKQWLSQQKPYVESNVASLNNSSSDNKLTAELQ